MFPTKKTNSSNDGNIDSSNRPSGSRRTAAFQKGGSVAMSLFSKARVTAAAAASKATEAATAYKEGTTVTTDPTPSPPTATAYYNSSHDDKIGSENKNQEYPRPSPTAPQDHIPSAQPVNSNIQTFSTTSGGGAIVSGGGASGGGKVGGSGGGGGVFSMAMSAATVVAGIAAEAVTPVATRAAEYVTSSPARRRTKIGLGHKDQGGVKTVFLHGVLYLEIYEAKDLPPPPGVSGGGGGEANASAASSGGGGGGFLSGLGKKTNDPYVTVDVCNGPDKTHRICKTRVVPGVYENQCPRWDESFRVDLCHDCDYVSLDLKDIRRMKSEIIGSMDIRGVDLLHGQEFTGWFELIVPEGSTTAINRLTPPSIRASVRFEAGNDNNRNCANSDSSDGGAPDGIPPSPSWSSSSVTSTPSFGAALKTNVVPDNYFPPRKHCRVTLYQDAHTPALPPLTDIITPNGNRYHPRSLWEDIADAMEEAQKFIYVVGWAVKADMTLRRGGHGNHEDLGELLKRKARSGVRVLVMVWDEAMSTEVYPPGVMGTHDEETKQYFRGSEVDVVLASRRKIKGRLRSQIFAVTTYTHHQKCVILDAPIDEGDYDDEQRKRRRIVAFAGGVDLTDGRYDTFEHSLYKTLPNEHRFDFYQKVCSPCTAKTGPREPWHDIHMKVEGRVAYDLLTNFVERWRCQASDRERRLLYMSEEEFDLDWKAPSSRHTHEPSWHVQFFRSINSDSAMFDFQRLGRLPSKKGRSYDDSIHRAYVHHIRRAKRFVYIENQYFLGSSHCWKKSSTKSPHLIPIELTTRILSAIRLGEPFKVYVVVPMYPEGDPTSAPVQAILHFQHQTMEMMYGKIACALREMGSNAHPTDYLSFFCLGKRERMEDIPSSQLEMPEENTVAWKIRQSLRFMIYVHSKMAIFDDEYIIVGTANINERSMNGNRDTELALGAYQSGLTKEDLGEVCFNDEIGARGIQGDVQTFRLSLWAEHCGLHTDAHYCPWTMNCMRYMRNLGEENLRKFLDPVPRPNDSHLLLYPVTVTADGRVEKRMDCNHFPDTGGLVIGQYYHFLPDSVTS